jgi:heptaprenyl diphosphate synthase
MSTKRIARLGLLVALAFVFSYIEFLIPISLGVPGAKLGLPNLVIMVALYTIGEKNAFALSMVRILLVGLTFGNMAMMMYSFAGGILSMAVMVLAKRSKRFSVIGVSVLGGVFHNVGQILVAMVVLETASLIYYLPVLLVAGVLAGVAIGVLGGLVTQRIAKLFA